MKRAALAAAGLLVVVAVVLVPQLRHASVIKPRFRFIEPRLFADLQPAGVVFTEAPATDGCTAGLSVATINDDTRFVLTPIRFDTVVDAQEVAVGADGRVSFVGNLSHVLNAADRLILLPQVGRAAGWIKLPKLEAAVEKGSVPKVHVDLAVPEAVAGEHIAVHVDGFAVAPQRNTAHRTATVRIPNGAVLDFAIGIAEAAWEQGAVAFAVQACRGEICKPVFAEALDPRSAAGRGWQNRHVALDALAGGDYSFLFTTRVLDVQPGAFSFPTWANPTIFAPTASRRGEVNIILLSIDTLRADHLTTYGYRQDTAPFIDETFAKGGTVFERCIAPAATTGPSHMTMFTSVLPSVHSVGTRTGMEVLPSWLLTLSESLRDGGFETAAVTEDGWLSFGGFGRGFNVYAENKSPDIWNPQGQVDQTFAKAKTWLTQNRDKRFFLFLHTYQVHSPYVPPARYTGLFTEHDGVHVTDQSPSHLRDLVAYDQEIRYCDDELRALFETIKQLALDKNTIFILVSDHGEEFLEHGRLEHGTQLYDEVTRVPMMFWGPGRIPPGRRISELVGLIDLMPTVLQLVGATVPVQVAGVSLADQLFGKPAGPERPYYSEAWGPFGKVPDDPMMPVQPPAFLVQVGNHKLMRYHRQAGVEYESYDLATDPGEHTNRYADGNATVAERRTLLDAYENTCAGAAMRLAEASQRNVYGTPNSVTLDPAQKEKLRALGYLE